MSIISIWLLVWDQYAASHTQNISKIYTFLAENTVIFSPFLEILSYFFSMRSCVVTPREGKKKKRKQKNATP